MLLQTNSYIVPKERRAEHARLLRRFRQILLRLGCDDFEVFEQMGPNWKAADATGRFVQLMRFRDRKHQRQVHAAEQSDPQAQQLINEFCDLINLPYQQQQGLLAIGYYQSVVEVPAASGRGRGAAAQAAQAEADESPEPMMGFGGFGLTGAPAAPAVPPAMNRMPLEAEAEETPAEDLHEEAVAEADVEEAPAEEVLGEEVLAEEIAPEESLSDEALAEEPAPSHAEAAPEASAVAEPAAEAPAESEDVFDLDFLAAELEPTGEQPAAPEAAISLDADIHAEPANEAAPVQEEAVAHEPVISHEPEQQELSLDLEPPAADTIAEISAEAATTSDAQPATEQELEALDLSDRMLPEEAATESSLATELPATESLHAEEEPVELQAAESEPAALVEEELDSLGEIAETPEAVAAENAAEPELHPIESSSQLTEAADVFPPEFQVEEPPGPEAQVGLEEPKLSAEASDANELHVADLLEPAEADGTAEEAPAGETSPTELHELAPALAEAPAAEENNSPLDVAHGLSDLDLDELHPTHIAPMEAMGQHAPVEAIALEPEFAPEKLHEAAAAPAADEHAAPVAAANGEHLWNGNGLPVHLTAEEGDIEIIYEALPEGADEASYASGAQQ